MSLDNCMPIRLLQYDDLDALEADFFLLCKNAQAYNEDSSLIFEDSIVLQSVFTNAREKLAGEWENEPDEPEEDATPAASDGNPKSVVSFLALSRYGHYQVSK